MCTAHGQSLQAGQSALLLDCNSPHFLPGAPAWPVEASYAAASMPTIKSAHAVPARRSAELLEFSLPASWENTVAPAADDVSYLCVGLLISTSCAPAERAGSPRLRAKDGERKQITQCDRLRQAAGEHERVEREK
jgi:hypothetical protein